MYNFLYKNGRDPRFFKTTPLLEQIDYVMWCNIQNHFIFGTKNVYLVVTIFKLDPLANDILYIGY